jgi:hypothetical protein
LAHGILATGFYEPAKSHQPLLCHPRCDDNDQFKGRQPLLQLPRCFLDAFCNQDTEAALAKAGSQALCVHRILIDQKQSVHISVSSFGRSLLEPSIPTVEQSLWR